MMHCSRFPFAALVFAAAAPALAADGSFDMSPEHLDCRYATIDPAPRASAPDPGSPLVGVLLPDNDLFRPLLADQREPRFYADYRRLRFRGSQVPAAGHGRSIDAPPVAFGGAFANWGLRPPRGVVAGP